MATAKQLPSGSWRVRVYDKSEDKYVSFTSKLKGKAGKAEAELMAREYQLGKKQKAEKGKTVGECIDEYIEMKENILSPTTIDGYRRCKINNLSDVCNVPLSELTALDIQKMVNKLALTKSPKTVKNAHGLLVSVLNVYAPDLRVNTTLPKAQKKIKQLPDVRDILQTIHGTEIELPCLLAVWCTLRISEVRGLKKSDISNGSIVIQRTIVTVKGEHIEKDSTKTVDSTRLERLPLYLQALIEALPKDQEYLTELSGQAIYKRFVRLLEKRGVKHMSFHDLRHMNASIMVALGIPDKYAMERGGWSSPHIMKSVYQHTFSAEREAVDDKIDAYFNTIISELGDTNPGIKCDTKTYDTSYDTKAE